MRRGNQTSWYGARRVTGIVRGASVSIISLSLTAMALLGVPEILTFDNSPSWIATAQARDDDWNKEARHQEREMRRQQREQDREARRQQREMERESRRQRHDAEREAQRHQREMEMEARNQQRMQPRDDHSPGNDHARGHDDTGSRPQVVKPDPDTARSPGRDVTSNKPDDTSRRRDDSKDDSGSGKNKPATKSDDKTAQDTKKLPQAKPEKDDDFAKPLPPPKTVLEMLERIASPVKPKPQAVPPPAATPAASPVKSAAPAKPATAKSASNAKAGSAFKRGAPDFELLQQGTFRPHEILAVNLTPQEQQYAEANGFKAVSSVATPGDTGTVSSLIVPPGMTETAALQFLERAAPAAQFGPNHIYRIVPAADGPATAAARDGPAEAGAATSKSSVCTAGDCIARDLLAWKPATKQCARRVRVGLIDTSFDVAHPAFTGRKFRIERFSGSHGIAQGDWHGTAVLSVLAGNASSSTPGLIPDAEFYLASTFRADAQGNAAADTISVLKALTWLDAHNVNIVNMSFSGPQNNQIEAAIAAMAAKGIVFVAAAGNQGPSAPPSYPAAYPQVVAVTAISKKLNGYLHANRGDYVDVAAPGVQVLTALPQGRQGYRTGTSFATPFVTGLLAAMPAVRKGAADKEEMLSRISFQDLGEPGRDTIYGEGLPKAPERCNDIGGVASLPWTNAAKRMSVGAPTPAESALARPASR